MLICAAAGLIPLGSPAIASEPGGPDDVRAYITANGLLNRGLFELAVPEYERFLQEHPEHPDAQNARYGLGVCLFRLGRHDEALEQLRGVLEGPPFEFRPEALLLAGHCRLLLGHFDRAAETFQTLASEHPDHDAADDALALRAEALYRAGEFGQARSQSDEFASRYPDNPLRERAELFGAMASLALNDLDDSIARFTAMLQRYPDGDHAPQATLLLARSQHRANSVEGAIRSYRRVVDQAVDSFMPEALLGLGQLLHASEQNQQATVLLDRLIDSYADSALVPAAQLERGRIAFEAGEVDRAQAMFESVADSDDRTLRDDASYWLAKCALREGDNDEAAEALGRAIERFPESQLVDEMAYDRAIALTREGASESAVIALSSFRSQFPDHELVPDALYTEASIEHQLGNYHESLALCEQFLRSRPKHRLAESVLFLAAENLFLGGDFAAAERRYRSLLDDHAGGTFGERSRFRLGMSLHRQDRFDEAEPLLRAVTRGAQTPEAFRSALLALGDGQFDAGRWAEAESSFSDYLAFGLDEPGADDALLKRGLARSRQMRPHEAIDDYTTLIDQFEDSSHRLHARFERGQALVELERWDEARTEFERVLDEDPRSRFAPYAMNHLGAISERDGEFREAAEWFGRAGAAGDGQLERTARYERGRALLADREYLDAAGVLAGLVEEHPTDPMAGSAQAYRAIALARADHLEDALREIERLEDMDVSRIDPPLAHSVQYERAWCLLELGRDEAAARAYRLLLGQPISRDLRAFALVDLAGVEMRAERHDEASPLLRESLQIIDSGSSSITPELAERAVYRLGACRLKQESYEDVVSLLDSFHERFPESTVLPSASLMCGEALLKLSRHSEALEHLERAVDAGPGDESYGPALLRLGETCATLQRWDRSREAFSAFLDAFPDSELWFQARFGVGWALESSGDLDGAIESYREVVNRHDGPTAARAQFQIGECHYARHDYEQAARELLKVDILYAYPEWSAASLFEAGRCFEALGQLTDARNQYDALVERFAESEWASRARERLGEVSRASAIPGQTGTR